MSWTNEKIVVFDDMSSDGTQAWLLRGGTRISYSLATNRGGVAINSNRAIRYFQQRKNLDVLLLCNDDLFMKEGSVDFYFDAIQKTGYDHFCRTDSRSGFTPSEEFEKNGVKLVRRITGDGVLLTITRKMVETLGGFDPGYGLCAGEHFDYSRRAAAAGFCRDSLDVVGAEKFVVVRQYETPNLPRSLTLKEHMEEKRVGSKKWQQDMDEEPVIFKEIVVE